METLTNVETILNQEFTFQTSPEVFSYHHLDKGSRFLLETLIPELQQVTKLPLRILDLGCGYGAIGLVLAKLNPESQVYLVDENRAAIGLAMGNAKLNNIENILVFRIDATRGLVLGTKFDLVVCNPPTHLGKQVVRDIIETASQNLKDNGRLIMVFNRLYSTAYAMEEVFGNFKLLATLDGYKLGQSLKISGYNNKLRDEVKNLLEKFKIVPDPLKGQYFLVDETVLAKIVAVANIQPDETVLEIGPGLGQITSLLGKSAKKVTAVEIDKRFRPILNSLPENVNTIYADALKINVPFDKLVANVPFPLADAIVHRLTHQKFRNAILIVPEKFAQRTPKAQVLFPISRSCFYPMHKDNSVAIRI